VKKAASPKPPSGGGAYKDLNAADEAEAAAKAAAGAEGGGFSFVQRNQTSSLPSWNLKF
jgi:hypothetical protein